MEHLFTTRIKHNDDGIFDLDLEAIKKELPEGYKHVNRDPVIRIDVAYIFVGLWVTPLTVRKEAETANVH